MTDKPNPQPDRSDDWPVVFSYTRAQALDDGVLIDLTEWAAETGFKIPVACTNAVWFEYLEPPEGTEDLGQSVRGRAHDLLWMLYHACRRAGDAQEIRFQVLFVMNERELEPRTITLKALIGPGDQGEPVLTVLQTHED